MTESASRAIEPGRDVRGVRVPTFLYGTAWKETATEDLVTAAFEAGFRGIDTANQRKHYHEAGVGRAIARWLADPRRRRENLFVQSKFTFRAGQDNRLPYDPSAAVADQVAQSFESSLEHLGLERLDSLVLHGPSQRPGLGDPDREAWRAMEALAEGGRVRLLGVSNVTAEQLEALIDLARIEPAFVQNRCYADRGWDGAVRRVCAERGIVYQGFSLLTANRALLAGRTIGEIAARRRRTPAQIVFRFALQRGMIPLTGTTDPEHMRQDLAVYEFALDDGELEAIEAAAIA